MAPLKLKFEEIFPFVRFASVLQYNDSTNQAAVSYDHRIMYVLGGTGTLKIEDKQHTLSNGSVMYWPSGTAYTIQPDPQESLRLLIINFDFTNAHSDILQPLPSVTPLGYNPANRLENLIFEDAEALNGSLVLQNVPTILPYLQKMVEEEETPQLLGSFQSGNLLRVVLTVLYRVACAPADRKTVDSFNAILDYVATNYAQPITNKELAARFNYHPNYISQLFTQHTGISLHQYLLRLRIRQALYLLQTTELPVNEVAAKTGFCSTSYFCQYFKKSTGYSPASFRLNK